MSVSKRLRYEVLRRDNYACRYCGATAPDVVLTVDHVVPVSLGGTDDASNLVTACQDCNNGKAASNPDAPLVSNVADDALRWSRAMATAAEAMLTARQRDAERLAPFRDHWNDWTYRDWKTGKQVSIALPADWSGSVDNLLAAGLPMEILLECIDVAMSRKGVTDEFRYMCGVAWNKVRELQEIASALVEVEPGIPENLDDAWHAAGADPAPFRHALVEFLQGGDQSGA